jgi:hypothetical protein
MKQVKDIMLNGAWLKPLARIAFNGEDGQGFKVKTKYPERQGKRKINA